MRPTGRLHIGHYFGALENWVRLQNDPGYECFYFIADWHALTSDYADTSGVAQNTIEIMTDYLAAGLDPAKSVIFQQSLVPEHAELHLLLSMVTPLSWLERVPTYKEALENVKDKDLHNYGFLGYPCLQTADIVIYSEPAIAGKEGKALFVPVGEDQVSHVEFSREIVRRFSVFYGLDLDPALFADDTSMRKPARLLGIQPWDRHDPDKFRGEVRRVAVEIGVDNLHAKLGDLANLFPYRPSLVEPGVMLTKTPRIPGLDGRKMSKSYGNAITLSAEEADGSGKSGRLSGVRLA
jgi:tryptophanyl-tRNA synthetase